jgi:hypothetical protein
MNRIALASIILVSAACARSTANGDDGTTEAPVSSVSDTISQHSDWTAIEQLEQQAKAIAKVTGCSSAGECKAAPVGSRGCGGPRYYIPYCAKTTDSAALYSKLEEVAKAEQAYNRKYHIISTCEFRMPPAPALEAGSCKGN